MKNPAILFLPAALLLLAGCSNDDSNPPPAPASTLYVVNSLGETLDRIDLETGEVQSNVLALGAQPNDIAVDASRGALWIANSGDNEVWRVDAGSLSKKVTDLGPNNNPYNLAILSDGRAVASNFVDGSIAVLDKSTAAVHSRRPVGRGPEALLAHGQQVDVTAVGYNLTTNRFATGMVYRFDLPEPSGPYGGDRVTGSPIGGGAIDSARVATNPQGLLFDAAGRLHVVCTGNYGAYSPMSSGEIRVLDGVTLDSLATIPLGGSPGAAILAGSKVYVSGFYGGLLKYDATTLAVERGLDHPILDAVGLAGLAWDADTHRLYVAGFDDDLVYVVDTTADTLVTAWSVGNGPIAVALGSE